MNIVKGLMATYGITSVSIARKLRVSHITVSVVITGKGKSKRIQDAIFRALVSKGAPIQYNDLWPGNGHTNHNRKAA